MTKLIQSILVVLIATLAVVTGANAEPIQKWGYTFMVEECTDGDVADSVGFICRISEKPVTITDFKSPDMSLETFVSINGLPEATTADTLTTAKTVYVSAVAYGFKVSQVRD